ncbi:MAG: TetR/AcrR family transcriptional regulator [Labilithrix sp.]|nr:TetR/AcrR family transcriptional regulator [Labilithrix sp.]MCW5815070.1 TetR/AcrR family transcriptional regulator [Labilithrix sp.]
MGNDTHQIFVTAALELMEEHGMETPTIRAVCTRAGFARATFYEYFKDRETLTAAVVDRLVSDIVRALVDVDRPGDLAAVVQNFAMAIAGNHRLLSGTKHWRLRHTLAACENSELVQTGYVRMLEDARHKLKEHVVAGQRERRIRDDIAADTIAGMLLGLAYGAIALISLGYPVNQSEAAEGLMKLLSAPQASQPNA